MTQKIDRICALAREELGATDAEVAVMRALYASDYSDLIGPGYLFQVARIAVQAAQPALARSQRKAKA